MSDLEHEIKRKSKQWLAYADEDLRLARHALKLRSGAPYRLVAYHAQQCAEKCLKAYLVRGKIDFPYTHNISLLLELCAGESKWADEITEAEELTYFAITTRYPGEGKSVTKKEALRAVEIAARVRRKVRSALAAGC